MQEGIFRRVIPPTWKGADTAYNERNQYRILEERKSPAMIHADHMRRLFIAALTLTILSGMMVFGQIQTVQAAEKGHRGQHFDSRHGHNRYYPSRGSYVRGLPGGYRGVSYHGSRYYFAGGCWYRPYGGRFLVIAPPFGLFIPFLPPFYETIWVSGVPYYYANDVYYTQAPGGYEVVEPPQDIGNEPSSVGPPQDIGNEPPSAEELFIYPRQWQTEQQKENDRYECHRWAANQTHYDPTQPPPGPAQAQGSQKRKDYQRAMSACLEARGYTVK
jgi:hypothetical protein